MRITDPCTLEIGDKFYESAYGRTVELTVTTKPKFRDGQWKWKAVTNKGVEVDYIITKGAEHYGPSIYSEPAYVGVK